MEITRAIIVFMPDVSVGIMYEEYNMELPHYTHDQVEVEELSEQIRVIYEPFCETKMTLNYQCTDGLIVDEQGGVVSSLELEIES